MNALVIYDSDYGNTAKVARAIVDALTPLSIVHLSRASDTTIQEVFESDIIYIGSPTQGGRPTERIQNFLKTIPEEAVKDKPVAVFDTRFASSQHGFGLKLLMKTIGFAAPKMASAMIRKGAVIIKEPEGFIVSDTKGPLDEGEVGRAFSWAQSVQANVS